MPRVTRSLQPYFRHDGTKAMTGNFDLDVYDLLTKNLRLTELGTTILRLRNRLDTIDLHMRVASSYAQSFIGSESVSFIKTRDIDDAYIRLMARDNDTNLFVECARLQSASEPFWGISRLGNLTVLADRALNFGNNPLLYTPAHHIVHVTMEQGVTDIYIKTIPAGTFDQDLHFSKLVFSVETAPSAGKSVSVSLSNGTDTMTVTISDLATTNFTTENAFDLDVSAEDLIMTYSQDGGGLSDKGVIVWIHHHITNV